MVNKEEAKQEPVAWPEAPKEIYLVVCGDDDCDLPFREHCEVTWCEDRIHATDIRYVRADTHPAPEAKQEALLDSTVPPHALYYPLSDYHRAPAEGPLNFTWIDKPHRLLYDLIAAVKFYANPAPSVNAQLLEALRGMVDNFCWGDMNDGEHAAIEVARAAIAAAEGKV